MRAAPAPRLGRFAWLRRWRRPVDRLSRVASAAVLALLALLTFSQAHDGITPEIALNRDFGQDYLMARALVDGIDPYAPVRALAEHYVQPTGFLARTTPAPHPPSMAVLTLPFLALDYTNAVRAWFAVQVSALLLGVYFSLRCVGVRWAWRLAPPVTLMLFVWAAVGLDVGLGQSTTPLLALLAGAACALCSRRPRHDAECAEYVLASLEQPDRGDPEDEQRKGRADDARRDGCINQWRHTPAESRGPLEQSRPDGPPGQVGDLGGVRGGH
jgi:Glycosyltransferase family 87